MNPSEQRPLAGSNTPKIARLSDPQLVSTVLNGSYLERRTPVLMVLGGAGLMTTGEMAAARPLFVDIARLCERIGAAVVDGGTDGGVMRLTGESRRTTGGSYPLIGVAPEGTIALPGSLPDANRVAIEPNHTHLIVVPGSRWGDESPWISKIALSISGARGAVAVVVGGGDVSMEDVREAVNVGIRVIAIADSGRTASLLASAADGSTKDSLPRTLVETGLVSAINGIEDPASATEAIGAVLE
jgi:hypothetical protein